MVANLLNFVDVKTLAARPEVLAHFPTAGSLNWFLRTHRTDLVDAGGLCIIAGRIKVNPKIFARVVIERGIRAAE